MRMGYNLLIITEERAVLQRVLLADQGMSRNKDQQKQSNGMLVLIAFWILGQSTNPCLCYRANIDLKLYGMGKWRSPVIRRDNPIRALFLYRDQIDQQTEDQVQSLTNIHSQCTTALDSFSSDEAMRTLQGIQAVCNRVLELIGETRHLQLRPTDEETTTTSTTYSRPPSTADRASQLNYEKPGPSSSASVKAKRSKNESSKRRGRSKDDDNKAEATTVTIVVHDVKNGVEDESQCMSSEESPANAEAAVASLKIDSNELLQPQDTESRPRSDTCTPNKKRKSENCNGET
ncbi:unnamed protein product [Linum tenue]|uniref:Uncharacterized protein n=1 Tax=Linum tenue TaxID=586396 RepID=A0AAV0LVF7_9ROSI|nr:unnamed protein product [Linum tenue]